jgi:hypothetical protein
MKHSLAESHIEPSGQVKLGETIIFGSTLYISIIVYNLRDFLGEAI